MTLEEVQNIWSQLQKGFSDDWLARLELVELCHQISNSDPLRQEIEASLHKIKETSPQKSVVIDDGLHIAHKTL